MIRDDMPYDDYRAADAVASSDLKLILRSPAHYYAKRLDPNRKDLVVAPEDGVRYEDVVASMAWRCATLALAGT